MGPGYATVHARTFRKSGCPNFGERRTGEALGTPGGEIRIHAALRAGVSCSHPDSGCRRYACLLATSRTTFWDGLRASRATFILRVGCTFGGET